MFIKLKLEKEQILHYAKIAYSKFKGEVKRDHLNNNLTDRLNSDIAIKKFQKKEKKKKEFIRPFDENKKSSYENYFNDLPKDDFSNRRILT